MKVFEEVANSWYGCGIKVFLKDGTFEEFLNKADIYFIARVNDQQWVGDKVVTDERYLHICAFDNSKPAEDGVLTGNVIARFPAGIWIGVRLISAS